MKKEFSGHYIREWRVNAEMTQAELAKAANMSASNLNQIEAGKTGYTQSTLERIAAVLKVSPAVLLSVNPREEDMAEERSDFLDEVIEILKAMSPPTRALAHSLLLASLRHEDMTRRISKTGINLERLNLGEKYRV
ncbi:MAG: helix-turn-helix domain-containing protein [Hyphomicrobiaceae bacterium]